MQSKNEDDSQNINSINDRNDDKNGKKNNHNNANNGDQDEDEDDNDEDNCNGEIVIMTIAKILITFFFNYLIPSTKLYSRFFLALIESSFNYHT